MKPVGIVIKPKIKEAAAVALELADWIHQSGRPLCLDQESYKALAKKLKNPDVQVVDLQQLTQIADPIVTLGGDGTLIGVARHVDSNSPRMIGVNFGNLGFLTEVHPNEALGVLQDVINDRASFGERAILKAEVHRAGEIIFSSQAVNDAVVQKGVRERLLDLDVAVNSDEVMRLRADGIIVATPTGSTAYSLSAGGSIAHPSLEVVLLTPICPHSLTNRPLILGLNSQITIRVPEYGGKVFLTVDGQVSTTLLPADELHITRANNKVRFVRSSHKNYFDILRTKLNWGIANKPE